MTAEARAAMTAEVRTATMVAARVEATMWSVAGTARSSPRAKTAHRQWPRPTAAAEAPRRIARLDLGAEVESSGPQRFGRSDNGGGLGIGGVRKDRQRGGLNKFAHA